MKTSILIKIFSLIPTLLFLQVQAQEVPKPAPPQEIPVILRNGLIHPGDGSQPFTGDILIMDGRIIKVGEVRETFKRSEDIDIQGKHVYPGIIALNTYLGLAEIDAARATLDMQESGEFNPGLRALVGYNTDSRVIGTVRSNGILMAQIVTQSGTIRGTSALVQLDAWNWEDAAVAGGDNALCIRWPEGKNRDEIILKMNALFAEARASMQAPNPHQRDLNLEALYPVLRKEKKVFIHANRADEILQAVAWAQKQNLDLVITGGYEAWKISDKLQAGNIPVVLSDLHRLPARDEEWPDLPYKNAALLKAAGIKTCLSMEGFWQIRNLPFMAGTAAAYGLSREEALRCITLNPAEILGVDSITGSIHAGKQANLLITTGDLLDMKSSLVEKAMIQGRWISLENKQTQLWEKFKK